MRRGLTLVELVIVWAVVAVLGATLLTAAQRGSGAFRRSSANTALDAKAARALSRIVSELTAAAGGRIDPPDPVAPLGSDALEFESPVQFLGADPVWGPRSRIAFERDAGEAANGADDDGDGLVDEGSAVLVRNVGLADEQRVVLARGVGALLEGELANAADDNGNALEDEPGLCFDLEDGLLNIRLSVQAIGPDRELMIRTLETAVRLRN